MSVFVVVSVLIAGAIGAVLRYLTARVFATASPFPIAVLIVNVIGSAIAGAILALADRGGISHDIRLVLLTGLCGGLTTFSTWSVETIQLAEKGKSLLAAINIVANLTLGVAAAALTFLALQ